jgi:hypothetical protein
MPDFGHQTDTLPQALYLELNIFGLKKLSFLIHLPTMTF